LTEQVRGREHGCEPIESRVWRGWRERCRLV
jgi:hypothetical protein